MKHLTFPLCLILCFLLGCARDPLKEHEKAAYSVMHKVSEILKTRHQLYYSGRIESGGKNGYYVMGLNYDHFGKITKDEGRKMIIDSVNTFLQEINSDPKLQKYLLKKPFLPADVWIMIFPFSIDGTDIFYPDIVVISAVQGKIFYKTKSPDQEYGYFTEEEEIFDEALRILEEQDKS